MNNLRYTIIIIILLLGITALQYGIIVKLTEKLVYYEDINTNYINGKIVMKKELI